MKLEYNYRYVLLMAFAASLGGFLFGSDTAVVSGSIGFLRAHFQLNAEFTGWAASSLLVGCMLGAIAAGPIGDRYGRKWSLFACAILFASSCILSASAGSILFFTWSRFVGGLAIGAISILSPLYIAEIAPKQIRGMLVALYQLAIVVGIFIVFFANLQVQRIGDETWNTTIGWRWMFASLVLPSGIFGMLLLAVSESPRWLMKIGRREEAGAVLEKLGGPTHAQSEIRQIEEALQQEEGRWSELFTPGYSRAVIIGVLLAVFGQFSGINAVMYFAPEIFKRGGATTDSAFVHTVIIGFINLLFTCVAIWFVDRAGRKPLLIIGTLLQTFSLVFVGIMFHQGLGGPMLLVSILVFVGAFAIAMGPITWIINSEIFPTKLRGRAMSLAIFTLWLADFLVTQTFPSLNQNLGTANTFWIYALLSLLSTLFIAIMVPETKGRTLEEIERFWIYKKWK